MRSIGVLATLLAFGAVVSPSSARVAAPPVPLPPPIPIAGPLAPALGGVSLSTNRAGAHPVTVIVRFASELRCGSPGPVPFLVTFPAAERLPDHIAPASVLVNGRPARALTRTSTTVGVAGPRQTGITCDVIVPGRVTIVFTPGASLGNPAKAGTYPISVRRGTRLMLRARFGIRG